MAKTTSSLVSKMKERIKESGANRKEVFYVSPDTKRRIRFLVEFDEGIAFNFHSHWDRKIDALCLEHLGKDCPYCAETDDEIKNIEKYGWPVFDYESNSVKILLDKATGVSPIPSLIEYFEEKGTIMDRDYTIKKNGKGQGSSYTVMPGEVSNFRNKKAKPWNEKQIMKILAEAFKPNAEDMEDEDDETPKKKKGSKKSAKSDKKGQKKKKKSLRDEVAELEKDDLRNIAIELGIAKKDLKGLDEEEILDLMFDDYDEDDIREIYDDYASEDEEDDDEDADEDDDE